MTEDIAKLSAAYSQLIEDSELPNKEAFAMLPRIAILGEATGVGPSLAIGVSRLGGDPDLPPDISWPTVGSEHHSFIAQINCEELPSDKEVPDRSLLPARGRLYFFYAPERETTRDIRSGSEPSDSEGWAIFYSEASVSQLVRTANPDPNRATWDRAHEFPASALHFAPGFTLPGFEADPYVLSANEGEPSSEYQELVIEASVFPMFDRNAGSVHQLLGHPLASDDCSIADLAQMWAPEQSQASTVDGNTARALDWELLLQVGSQPNLSGKPDNRGMCWGDCGAIYFMMRRSDLLARRWGKVWLVLQS